MPFMYERDEVIATEFHLLLYFRGLRDIHSRPLDETDQSESFGLYSFYYFPIQNNFI